MLKFHQIGAFPRAAPRANLAAAVLAISASDNEPESSPQQLVIIPTYGSATCFTSGSNCNSEEVPWERKTSGYELQQVHPRTDSPASAVR